MLGEFTEGFGAIITYQDGRAASAGLKSNLEMGLVSILVQAERIYPSS